MRRRRRSRSKTSAGALVRGIKTSNSGGLRFVAEAGVSSGCKRGDGLLQGLAVR